LVNPHDIDGMARTIETAISMPLPERRMRWDAMMARLARRSLKQWVAEFVDALREAQIDNGRLATPEPEPPLVWPRRSANVNARFH
jgi:trehalose 6-phosphate synthase